MTCPHCGNILPPPTRPSRARQYCSQECAWAASRGRRNGGGHDAPRCTDEGAGRIATLLVQRASTGAVRLGRLRGNVLLEGLAFGAILAGVLASIWALGVMSP